MKQTLVETHYGQPTVSSSRRPAISLSAFFVITFAVSWLGAIPMIVASWRPGPLPPGLGLLQLLLFFGTALSTLFVVWWNEGRAGVMGLLKRYLLWRVGWRWYAFVFLGPALLFWSALRLSGWLAAANSMASGISSTNRQSRTTSSSSA
ncbi:MAG: hypothetical protein DYG89_27815 [Caldilinea sp. CFX5]|nr:hypothetical protein [Caldilinea sp. CFX5]